MSRLRNHFTKLKKWFAPTATIVASAAILTGAAWIHRMEISHRENRSVNSNSVLFGASNGSATTAVTAGNNLGTGSNGAQESSKSNGADGSSGSNVSNGVWPSNTSTDNGTTGGKPSVTAQGKVTTPPNSFANQVASHGSPTSSDGNGNTSTVNGGTSQTNQASTENGKITSQATNTPGGNASDNASKSASNSTTQSHSAAPGNQSASKSDLSAIPTKDVGFSPVMGGKVTDLTVPRPTTSTTISSVLVQYGPAPQTTWSATSMTNGSGTTLTIPDWISPHSLMVLPEANGVLWAVASPTLFNKGDRGPAVNPTTLYYTRYPSSGSASLVKNSVTLATIPVSAPASAGTEWTGWYGAATTHAAGGKRLASNSNLSTAPSSKASTSSTANNTTASSPDSPTAASSTTNRTAAAGNDTSPTTADKAATAQPTNLYLQGLYHTSVGAVIVLSVGTSNASTNELWTYLWNEKKRSLTPMTVIDNGAGSYGWMAVANDVVYWESRQLIGPTNVYYTGAQFMMNVASLQVFPIHLGTYATQAIAQGDNLVFQVQNTPQWKKFVPDPATVVAQSTH